MALRNEEDGGVCAEGGIPNSELNADRHSAQWFSFYMKELTVSGSSSFILCCVRWPDMAVI